MSKHENRTTLVGAVAFLAGLLVAFVIVFLMRRAK
jgi:uncharacterized protein involved in exopolysaccharide biosynthesis